MRANKGKWGIAPLILNIGCKCRYVANFPPRPLCPRGKEPPVPIEWAVGGARPGLSVLPKRSLASVWIRTPDSPVRRLLTVLITLNQLLSAIVKCYIKLSDVARLLKQQLAADLLSKQLRMLRVARVWTSLRVSFSHFQARVWTSYRISYISGPVVAPQPVQGAVWLLIPVQTLPDQTVRR
jgi:hypothetical protein